MERTRSMTSLIKGTCSLGRCRVHTIGLVQAPGAHGLGAQIVGSAGFAFLGMADGVPTVKRLMAAVLFLCMPPTSPNSVPS